MAGLSVRDISTSGNFLVRYLGEFVSVVSLRGREPLSHVSLTRPKLTGRLLGDVVSGERNRQENQIDCEKPAGDDEQQSQYEGQPEKWGAGGWQHHQAEHEDIIDEPSPAERESLTAPLHERARRVISGNVIAEIAVTI